jgi:predicted outer membrane repeat protein
MATRHCLDFAEMPDSRMQVYLSTGGELDVHDNVTFEANTARDDGGAVRFPFVTFSPLPAVVFCDWSVRQSTTLCRKG